MVAAPFPARIGRYELLVPIASGGMATVYLARLKGSAGFDRLVALKRIHPHLREEPSFVLDFLDEARLAGKIHHPNVVAVLDADDDAHGPYLVMDYVEGDSLASLQRAMRAAETSCDPAIALRILDDALAGLQAAHELAGEDGTPLGVVHRDFSPQNILVGTDGHSRLTDFGIAKAASHGGRTRTGHIKGKISYMPPEQLRDQPIDRRADVWAAGVVAWELFANRRLFEASDEVANVMSVIEGKLTPLRDVRPELPAALEDAIQSALEPDPKERCPSAAELRRRIMRASTELGPLASAGDVGAWVRRLAGEKIARRTSEAQSTSREREDQEEIETQISPPETVALASAPAPEAQPKPRSKPKKSSRWPVIVGAISFVGATATGFFFMRGQLLSPRARPTASATASASTTSITAEIDASAAPSANVAASSSIASTTTVSVAANAPMREVHVGERVITLARPVNAIAVEVTASERSAHAPIVAVGIDGRTAEASLSESTKALSVTFSNVKDTSARTPPHGKRTPTPPATSKPTSTGESLLPSPYPGATR